MFKAGVVSKSTGGGGGGDVTPNPTPAWSAISASDLPSYTYTTQQVTGIDTTINIRITTGVQFGTMPTIYIKSTPTSPSFGPFDYPPAIGFTELTVGTLFAVAPNSYISFGCDYGVGGNEGQGVVSVLNNSDGSVLLSNFLATSSFS
jgi:hypothetical protein